MTTETAPTRLGDYLLGAELASGGMATVYVGRHVKDAGPGSAVAVKRLHRHLARDPDFRRALLDEARVARGIHHPNVIRTREVVSDANETFLVMDLAHGESLANLWKASVARSAVPALPITRAIVADILRGLGAAHRAVDAVTGAPLELVHRDVSPQNVIVDTDGVARLLDFGVAHAAGRLQGSTEEGKIKGKIAYMAPEQVTAGDVTARSDLFSAGVVLWELVTGRRLYEIEDRAKVLFLVANGATRSASDVKADLPQPILDVLSRALAPRPDERYGTADEMADALAMTGAVASRAEVAEWVSALASSSIAQRSRHIDAIERMDPADARLASTDRGASEEELAAQTTITATLETTSPRPAPRSRARLLLAGVGLLALATLATGIVASYGRRGTASAAPPPQATTVEVAETGAPPSAPPGATAASLPVSPPAAASTTALAAPRPSAKASPRRAVTPASSTKSQGLYDRY
ncbi:MAG: protein kinase [Deltaproteobacteria bacterium]|nr:protein kinase [Deltaproteobacteria bacterium]